LIGCATNRWALTSLLIDLADRYLAPLGFEVGTPSDPTGVVATWRSSTRRRRRSASRAPSRRGIIPDFRPPNVIRLAPVPLYTRYRDVGELVLALRSIVESGEYLQFPEERGGRLRDRAQTSLRSVSYRKQHGWHPRLRGHRAHREAHDHGPPHAPLDTCAQRRMVSGASAKTWPPACTAGWRGKGIRMTQNFQAGSVPASEAMPSTTVERLHLRLVAPLSDMQALEGEIAASGGTVVGREPFVPKSKEQEQYLASLFEPITVAVCVVTLTWAAERIMRMIKLADHSGVIVDLTGPAAEVREHSALPPGSLLVLTPESAELHESGAEAIDMLSLLTRPATPGT
jgi:hypothetical protein